MMGLLPFFSFLKFLVGFYGLKIKGRPEQCRFESRFLLPQPGSPQGRSHFFSPLPLMGKV